MGFYIVVGGGLAGLTAANSLAEAGHQVRLLEQSCRLGGRAQTQQHSGYCMNLGPHALYCGGTAFRTFRQWKVLFSGNVPPSGGKAYFLRDRKLFPAVRNLKDLVGTQLFSVAEKLQAARIFHAFANGSTCEGENMRHWIERHAQSPRVRQYAATISRIATYAADFDSISAKAAVQQISLAIRHGVWYLNGGWQTLIDGLHQRALSLGVDVRTGTQAVSLNRLDADGIVLAVGPAGVEKITGITLPGKSPLHMATLDIGLRKLPEGAAHVAFALDRPLYFSVHSESAQLALNGHALVHVAKYLVDASCDPKSVREELEDYASLLMPGWQREAEVVRFLPNLTVVPIAPTVEGRPDVDFTGLENVTVAGDWVGNEGMLADAAVASALKAARVVQMHTRNRQESYQ